MIDPQFLELLRCPETRQPLSPADPSLLERLNQEITAGRLRNRGGEPVVRAFDGGLIRQDGRYLYPICQDIPVLLIVEAIPLDPPVPGPARGC
jgi:uncharacterized protein YbaR (Trm112 family)